MLQSDTGQRGANSLPSMNLYHNQLEFSHYASCIRPRERYKLNCEMEGVKKFLSLRYCYPLPPFLQNYVHGSALRYQCGLQLGLYVNTPVKSNMRVYTAATRVIADLTWYSSQPPRGVMNHVSIERPGDFLLVHISSFTPPGAYTDSSLEKAPRDPTNSCFITYAQRPLCHKENRRTRISALKSLELGIQRGIGLS